MDSLKRGLGHESKLILSIACAAGADALRAGYDIPGIAKHVDFFNVMTYDYYGPWKMAGRTNLPNPPPGAITGAPSPLYSATPPKMAGTLNCDWTLKYYGCRLDDMSKVFLKLDMNISLKKLCLNLKNRPNLPNGKFKQLLSIIKRADDNLPANLPVNFLPLCLLLLLQS